MGGEVPRELWGSQTGGHPPSDPCCTHMLLQECWMGTPPNASPSSSGVGEQLAWGFQPLCYLIGTPCLAFSPNLPVWRTLRPCTACADAQKLLWAPSPAGLG